MSSFAPRFAILIAVLTLVGCGASLPRQAFNAEANAQIKRIDVLSMNESTVETFVLNNPAYSFGLIGFALAETNRAARSSALRSSLQAVDFDHTAVFAAELRQALEAKGYEVSLPQTLFEGPASKIKRDRFGLREDYPQSDSADALLDLRLGFIGYRAAGVGDDSPYRPALVLTARLVDARSGKVLFTDEFLYGNPGGNQLGVVIEPDSRFAYPQFSDLEEAGAASAEGLGLAIEAILARMAQAL